MNEFTEYIKTLTGEQLDKLAAHIDLVKLITRMSENQLVYIETLLTKLYG